MLIALPKGAILSGITTWAISAAAGLVRLGHRVSILVHDVPGLPVLTEDQIRLRTGGADVTLLSGMPPIDAPLAAKTASERPEFPSYRDEIQRLRTGIESPVICIPTYSAECFAIFAAASKFNPSAIRVLGWMHNDIAYDRRTLEWFEPSISRFVAVSGRIERALRETLGDRSPDVRRVPYGVPIPPPRSPGSLYAGARPLRLVYAGRFDHEQKRVLALVEMSRTLTQSGVRHELTLIGDGPARAELEQIQHDLPEIRLRCAKPDGGPLTPSDVRAMLNSSDVFLMASRYEGLSIAMLEAMAHGCVPVVTDVSGARDALGDHPSIGELVQAPDGFDFNQIGQALAMAVQCAIRRGIAQLSVRAAARAAEQFSDDLCSGRIGDLVIDAAESPPRNWPPERAVTTTGMTVPPDADARMARVLAGLEGRTVALWGAGRHTSAVDHALRAAPATVAAVLDDDAANHGRLFLHLPIVGPGALPGLGVTDVVISSAMHEPALWARKEELERLGLRVHRLYAADASPLRSA